MSLGGKDTFVSSSSPVNAPAPAPATASFASTGALHTRELGETEPTLELVPYTVAMATLTTSALELCLAQLLRTLYFSSSFVCVTVVEDEVSLMLDARDVALFPDGTLALTPDTWRLIRVFEGPAANDSPGYINQFTAPLTEHGIVTLDLSTFYADLLIVKEDEANKAYEILKRVDAKARFVGLVHQARNSPLAHSLITSMAVSASAVPLHNSFGLRVLSNVVRLLTFPRSELRSGAGLACLELLLRRGHANKFLSFIASHDELSLALDQADFEACFVAREALESVIVHANQWRAIQFTAGSFGLGTCPVSQIAPILAQMGISIYYLSTCNDDFILVQSEDVAHAVEELKAGFAAALAL